MEKAKSILLIGSSKTGKTNFGAKLYGYLRQKEGQLILNKSPDNISLFEEALNKLNQGLLPSHTSTETYQNMALSVTLAGKSMALVWPDYGGEQIQQILERRQVNSNWQQRVAEAEGWLFFIRLEQLRDYNDILSRPIGDLVRTPDETDNVEVKWSEQAHFIELLQILLFTKGIETIKKVKKPVLGIILSCWDELDGLKENVQPTELLRQRTPLLSEFVNAIWEKEAHFVMGLSSLGKSLKTDQEDEEYIEIGPEEFGYVIRQNGTKSHDLTLPIVELIQRIV